MQFSTLPALAALLMATVVLSKACSKGHHPRPHLTTLSTSVVPTTFSLLPLFPDNPSSVVETSGTAISSTTGVAAPSSTTSSSSVAATTTASSGSSSLTSDQQQALDIQNSARSDVSETGLVWDDTLASNALSWAQNLASSSGSSGTLTHSSGTGEGENLYWQSDSDTPYTNAANAWVDEKSSYDGEAITGSGNFEEYGHYTQIIWESTTKVGMGIASDGAGGYYVVARYTPEGNVIGETPSSG